MAMFYTHVENVGNVGGMWAAIVQKIKIMNLTHYYARSMALCDIDSIQIKQK